MSVSYIGAARNALRAALCSYRSDAASMTVGAGKIGRDVCSQSPAMSNQLKEMCSASSSKRLYSQLSDRREYKHFGNASTSRGTLSNRRQLFVVAGAASGAIWWLSLQEVPYTGRRHAMLVPVSTEKALGQATFDQVMADARKHGTALPKGHPAQNRVERIGGRIQKVATNAANGGGFQAHMQGLEWEFVVIDSDQLNAFVLPGGKVVVFKKMLDLCSTDDELASVIAHEAGHVLARHAGERLTSQSWMTVIQLAFLFVLGFEIPAGIFEVALMLPNSRKQEMEADQIGMILAAQACFDPAAGEKVFTRLGAIERRMSGGNTPTLLRTHPLSDTRVTAIGAFLPEARRWAESAGCASQKQQFFDFFR